MKILNIFRLSNGETVFGGIILNHPQLIEACCCELKFEDKTFQTITIMGERIMKKYGEDNELRAVFTLEKIELTIEEAQTGKWKLVFTNPIYN